MTKLDQEPRDVFVPLIPAVGEPAEKWRDLAISHLETVQRLAGALAIHLGRLPNDDEGFEQLAQALQAELANAGQGVDIFRQMRVCTGGQN